MRAAAPVQLPLASALRYRKDMDYRALLASTSARPWPLPASPWIMIQVWERLLFAHWPVALEALRPLIPPGLTLDSFDGQAWVGIVPFQMDHVRFRDTPGVLTARRFAEINVRTYVTKDGKPGVYFFSLDAGSLLAVMGARLLFALPYYHARFAVTLRDAVVHYRCERLGKGAGKASRATFEARYRPTGPVQFATPGSLEDFLTARFCLYTTRRSRLLRAEVHHAPWPLHPAEADIQRNTMTAPAGVRLPATAPLLHYSERLEVLVWPLRRV